MRNSKRMLGSDREYLERQLPQTEGILCTSIEEALKGREVVVLNKKGREFVEALGRLTSNAAVLDLVRLKEERTVAGSFRYTGICW